MTVHRRWWTTLVRTIAIVVSLVAATPTRATAAGAPSPATAPTVTIFLVIYHGVGARRHDRSDRRFGDAE
ncbi:MAG TPA: hypothetical protein VFT39_07015 [Vicinamibacterales bacterium]|nr:hypothetical protein [Vicinamibacterales bacterium]